MLDFTSPHFRIISLLICVSFQILNFLPKINLSVKSSKIYDKINDCAVEKYQKKRGKNKLKKFILFIILIPIS